MVYLCQVVTIIFLSIFFDTNIDYQCFKKLNKIKKMICSVETCPVTLTTQIIGGKWKPLIIFLISTGVNRFGQMQRGIPSISKKMLTQELRDLEQYGILHRQIFPEIPPRVEYTLTDWGKAALPILRSMAQWGESYRVHLSAEPPLVLEHQE
jgi:DNA-binding HxlR family transcriptional regulator